MFARLIIQSVDYVAADGLMRAFHTTFRDATHEFYATKSVARYFFTQPQTPPGLLRRSASK